MLNIKVAEKVDVQAITKFLALVAVAGIAPFYIHLQWFTGPMVNAIFILILFLSGRKYAYLACLIPSLMALAGGLLPVVLAPVIPFIMLGNIAFVAGIDIIYTGFATDRGYTLAVLGAAFMKFILLQLSVVFISHFIIKKTVVMAVMQMMSWPQFATAVIGGLIAWIFLKWLKRF